MKKVKSLFLGSLLVAALLAVLPAATAAQSQDDQPQADPPGRVARLNYSEGSISYQVSGDTDWVQADPNRPLTTGDNLWSDQNSRGEVHIGSTAIRLSSETGISFLNLDDRTAQIQLAQGDIEIHLRNLEPGDAWEIDTPNLAFTLIRAGEYRISTDPNSNTTIITVREGEGSVTGGGDSYDLSAGQEYMFTGTDQLSYDVQPAPDFDDFSDWCQSRDQMENESLSARYVSRDVDGYYDLDRNGTWTEVPDYGEVWIPQNVEPDWVPYHVGHWVWIAPWGWTWVDAEPWGWAPFHYGRWVLVGTHWGWLPGPRVVRPVWAPALVGFVGGPGFGLSVSFGGGFAGVAWFPLGPRDVFVPGYHCSERYVQYVNVTNTRIVNVTEVRRVYVNRTEVENHYTYENNARAVTAVSRETFVSARPVHGASVRVTDDQIRNVRVSERAALAPTRESYVSSTARVAIARPRVPIADRPVVAHLNPAAPVNRRVPQYTNESRVFNQPPDRTRENARGTEQDNGFRPFTPPPNGARPNANTNTNTSGGAPNYGRVQENRTNQNVNRPNTSGGDNQSFNRPNTSGGNPNVSHVDENRPNQNFNRPNTSGENQNFNRPNTSSAENESRPAIRYTPPVKATDRNYDVHPPLNQPRPPKPESKPPKPEKPHEGKPHSPR